MTIGIGFRCAACGQETAVIAGLLQFRPRGGRVVGLRHPCEDEDLRAMGVDPAAAERAGLVWQADDCVCLACGRVCQHVYQFNPTRSWEMHWVDAAGIWAGFGLLMVGYAWNPLASEAAWLGVRWLGIGGIAAGLWGLRRLDERLTRRRHPERVRPGAPTHCPSCRSERVTSFSAFAEMVKEGETAALRCGGCGGKGMVREGTWMA